MAWACLSVRGSLAPWLVTMHSPPRLARRRTTGNQSGCSRLVRPPLFFFCFYSRFPIRERIQSRFPLRTPTLYKFQPRATQYFYLKYAVSHCNIHHKEQRYEGKHTKRIFTELRQSWRGSVGSYKVGVFRCSCLLYTSPSP